MTAIELVHTPYGAPKANALCERFVGSARREFLDTMLIFGERQLARVLGQYIAYFSAARPHQGLGQRIPLTAWLPVKDVPRTGRIVPMPVLNGLHHDYRQVVHAPSDGAVMAGRTV